jgi:uncharacterized protein involved in cysteine biosynthesis
MTAMVSFMAAASLLSFCHPDGDRRNSASRDNRMMTPHDVVDVADPAAAAPFLTVTAVDPALARPGRWRRAAAGAWHVPAGAVFLIGHPRLWALAIAPAVLGMAAVAGGVALGIVGIPRVDAAIGAHRPHLPDLLDLFGLLGLWLGTLGAGAVGALALVLFLCAPLLEWLERRTEVMAGSTARAGAPRRADVQRAWRHSFYLLALMPIAFALALVPFAGPFAAGVLISLLLPFQLTAAALARRGLDVAGMRRWHREWRAEVFGFGATALLLLPVLAPVLAPTLVIGAARLVQETSGDGPPAPRDRAVPEAARPPASDSIEMNFE